MENETSTPSYYVYRINTKFRALRKEKRFHVFLVVVYFAVDDKQSQYVISFKSIIIF